MRTIIQPVDEITKGLKRRPKNATGFRHLEPEEEVVLEELLLELIRGGRHKIGCCWISLSSG